MMGHNTILGLAFGIAYSHDSNRLPLAMWVRKGLFNICMKILGSQEGGIKCMLQLEAFRRRERCFGCVLALSMKGEMSAHQWWGANVCSEEAGELRSVAMKVNCQATCHVA